jgi:hypothetical protein
VLARVPDLPQGRLKKIQFQRLPADLPLKLRDPPLRLRQFVRRRGRRHHP